MNLFDAFFNQRTLYFDIFDKFVEAVYVCDIHENIIYLNKVAERLDGYLLKDVKGKSTHDLYGLDKTRSPMLKALATECPVHNEEFTYYVNGKENVQLCNAGPIYNNGALVGAYTVQRDLTNIKEIVEKNIALQHELVMQKSRMVGEQEQAESFANIIGTSDIFMRCKELAARVAKTDSSVLLVGSTGSGKEIFARAIHDCSNRSKGSFLALNCAAIPETLIEGILFGTTKGVYTGAVEKEGILAQADGGTIFLDEVNSMPLASQAKLLRVLEEKKILKLGSNAEEAIDIRIISSTNEVPSDAISDGHLREDLFYRLSVVQIAIPPLQERREDIDELVQHFIDKYNRRFRKNIRGIDRDVRDYFMTFAWPGNVRQLKACVESAMNFAKDGGLIAFGDLPQYIFDRSDAPERRYRQWISPKEEASPSPVLVESQKNTEEIKIMDSIWDEEKNAIIQALRQAKGNKTKAAAALGMSRQLLSYHMKKYNLK